MTTNILLTLIGIFIGGVLGYVIARCTHRCNHDWRLIREIDVYDADGAHVNPIYTKLVYECAKCKKIRKKRI